MSNTKPSYANILDTFKTAARKSFDAAEIHYANSRKDIYDALAAAFQMHQAGIEKQDVYKNYLKKTCSYEPEIKGDVTENDTLRALYPTLKLRRAVVSNYAIVLKWFKSKTSKKADDGSMLSVEDCVTLLNNKGIFEVIKEYRKENRSQTDQSEAEDTTDENPADENPADEKPNNLFSSLFEHVKTFDTAAIARPEKPEYRVAVVRVGADGVEIVGVASKADADLEKSVSELFKAPDA